MLSRCCDVYGLMSQQNLTPLMPPSGLPNKAPRDADMSVSPLTTTESNASTSPPLTRDTSPSPSVSPTPALSACPPLGRSFSATSTASTFSRQSTASRSSSASTAIRQRGYVRPQGATFAASASNRDSVLSLGSIAHLQYYFARTGLLDGKGGQLAKDQRKKPTLADGLLTSTPKSYAGSDTGISANEIIDSPAEEFEEDVNQGWDEGMMLPPTVSTYSHRVRYLPPPPDSETLRNDLNKALHEAGKALQEVQDHNTQVLDRRKDADNCQTSDNQDQNLSTSPEPFSGWYKIQGMHILDVVTLAIRAAKMYYTTHEHPKRLYSIKSERQIREELLGVLDVLKRMASRDFVGGIKDEELRIIRGWVNSIERFVEEEQGLEKQETSVRENWSWLGGSWIGREREREWHFMCSFIAEGSLPEWMNPTESGQLLSPFIQLLRSGLTLVTLQNAMLKKSKRQFGEIKSFHLDTAKPYRCADNLRYWIKSAEIRWETKLRVDVMGVVHGKNEALIDFDAAILQWSRAAREELTKEWREGSVRGPALSQYPEFQESTETSVEQI